MNLLEGWETRLGGLNLRDPALDVGRLSRLRNYRRFIRGDDPLDHCQCSSQLTQISSYASKVSLIRVIIKSLI